MRRTEQVQGLRLMKFEEVYGRTLGWLFARRRRRLSRVRKRRRWHGERSDRRLGRLQRGIRARWSGAWVPEFKASDRFWDFTAKHFHESWQDGDKATQLQLAAA